MLVAESSSSIRMIAQIDYEQQNYQKAVNGFQRTLELVDNDQLYDAVLDQLEAAQAKYDCFTLFSLIHL